MENSSNSLVRTVPIGGDGLSCSREMSIWPNPFKSSCDHINQLVQHGSGFCRGQHQSRQHRPQSGDRVSQIGREMTLFVGIKRGAGEINKGHRQITELHLGQEVLAYRFRQLSREKLNGQATLQQLETLLNAPAPVIKGCKLSDRIARPVQ